MMRGVGGCWGVSGNFGVRSGSVGFGRSCQETARPGCRSTEGHDVRSRFDGITRTWAPQPLSAVNRCAMLILLTSVETSSVGRWRARRRSRWRQGVPVFWFQKEIGHARAFATSSDARAERDVSTLVLLGHLHVVARALLLWNHASAPTATDRGDLTVADRGSEDASRVISSSSDRSRRDVTNQDKWRALHANRRVERPTSGCERGTASQEAAEGQQRGAIEKSRGMKSLHQQRPPPAKISTIQSARPLDESQIRTTSWEGGARGWSTAQRSQTPWTRALPAAPAMTRWIVPRPSRSARRTRPSVR